MDHERPVDTGPVNPRQVAACLNHKMGDYRPVLPDVQLRLEGHGVVD